VSVTRRILSICALVALVAASCTTGHKGATPSTASGGNASSPLVNGRRRPNILILLSDDQAFHLFDRQLMPNVFSKLVDQGVDFARAYVNVSQCCPSRSSILTGLYSRHTGVDSNTVALDGRTPARPTMAVALHDAGYRTMLAGKYLNSEPCSPQPGWDQWVCGTKVSEIDPLLNVNGEDVQYEGYTADILADFAVDFVKADADPDHPFFIYYAPRDPHLPANDDRENSLAVPPYKPPSYDAIPDPASRPAWARIAPLSPEDLSQIQSQHRKMTRQIPPLDAAMGKILDALGNREGNTLVFFLSDNGFMYGEHRLTSKNEPYEESVRVPFVVRFPGALPRPGHFSSDALVSNVDIAPTIMDAAGIPWEADGTSLLPILRGQKASVRDGLLIEWCEAGNESNCRPETSEYTGVSIPAFFGIVTERYVFVRYKTGETELYDLKADPYEMTNLAADPAERSLVGQLSSQLDALVAPPDTPGTTIVGGPVGTVPAGSMSFSFFSQARTTKLLCGLSGPGQDGGMQPCDSGVLTYPSLGPGQYTFTVQAVDARGRQDPTPAVRRFTVSG